MKTSTEIAVVKHPAVAVVGGGCFWCMEAVFQELKGIIGITSGYAGGSVKDPSYDQVSYGKTGHAEVVKVEFDSSELSYADLLTVYFALHDPTTLNRQGNDVGPQYRSIVMYTNDEQKQQAEAYIKELEATDYQGQKIVTEVVPLDEFYPAEKYHQNYYDNNPAQPYCQYVISPKVTKVREKFRKLLKEHKK